MNEIVFVTSNKGKIAYANRLIVSAKVIPFEADLVEPRSDDIKAIAKEKVRQAFKLTGKPCIAMDIGFYLEAWNGFPRAYVNPALETLGIKGILKLMAGEKNRTCAFKECLAYYDGANYQLFESEGTSQVATTERGQKNDHQLSELWSIVIPDGFDKTLSEFNAEDFEKYKASQEESSLSLFSRWYQNQMK